jgi:Cytolethal distending toxin A/C domain
MYDYDGLPGNGKCWYGRERLDCQPDQVYVSKCSEDPRQYFEFIRIAGNQVLFKVHGRNLCFESGPNPRPNGVKQIFLRPCDPSKSSQQWFAPNGDFDGYRFEASQEENRNLCMTQDHHPKAAEVVELHSCTAARSLQHLTSYWNKY